MKEFDKITYGIEKTLEVICVVLTIIITFAAFMQVFTRFVLGSAWRWTDEACRFCLVWLAMMGAALGVKRKVHVAIDVIQKKFPPKVQTVVEYVSYLATTLLGVGLIYSGIKLCDAVKVQHSPVLKLPMSLVYAAIPILGFFLAWFSITVLIEKKVSRKGGEE